MTCQAIHLMEPGSNMCISKDLSHQLDGYQQKVNHTLGFTQVPNGDGPEYLRVASNLNALSHQTHQLQLSFSEMRSHPAIFSLWRVSTGNIVWTFSNLSCQPIHNPLEILTVLILLRENWLRVQAMSSLLVLVILQLGI